MNKTDIETLCRICLRNSYLYSNIYVGNSANNIPIYEAINYVYDLKISVDDGLPEYTCKECLSIVEEFKAYKTNAQKARTELILLKEKMVSIKEEDRIEEDVIDIHSDGNYHKGIADQQEMGGPIQLKEELGVYPSENQEPGDAILPNDGLIEDSLPSCVGKDESPEDTKENFQVFAETIIANNLEVEEDAGVRCEEFGTDCYDKIMQKRKLNHFVDACSLQTSNAPRYANCAGHEEEQNPVTFQYVDEYGAQQEEGKLAIKSTSEKRSSECEDIQLMGMKEEENDQCDVGENQVMSQWENNGSKEREEESENGFSELRRIRIAKIAVEETCLISEREDGVRCHHCGDRRETKQEMAAHIRVVHGFSCREDKDPRNELTTNDCSEKMSNGEHSRDCCGGKRHICNVCDKTVISNSKPYKCSICNSAFTQERNLKRHIRVHTGEKPFKCSICNFRFAQNGSLKRHMRTHSGEKQYYCSICDYRCTENGTLKRHLRTHSGEKPYQCSICNIRFSCDGSLKRHLRIHSGEKPYKCSICNSRYLDNTGLKRHMLIHSGEKPYKCSICDFRCADNGNLKRHMRNHNK